MAKQKSAGDRAYMHYKAADKYRSSDNDAKYRAHLRRGDYYTRVASSPGFGVGEDDQGMMSLMVVGKRAFGSMPASEQQRQIIDALIAAEYRGKDTGRVATLRTGNSVLCSYRSRVTGGICVFTVPNDDTVGACDSKRELLDASLAEALKLKRPLSDVCDANKDVHIAEDFRDGMLVIGDATGGWRDSLPFERYAYYHFMLGHNRSALYINKSAESLFKESSKAGALKYESIEVIPNAYFSEHGVYAKAASLFQQFTGLGAKGEPIALLVERSRDCSPELYFRPVEKTQVDDSDNVRILKPMYIAKPESLITGRIWDSKVEMPVHRARMILGITLETPSQDQVREQFEFETGKLMPDITEEKLFQGIKFVQQDVKSKCMILLKAAQALGTGSTLKCDIVEIARSKRDAYMKQSGKDGHELGI